MGCKVKRLVSAAGSVGGVGVSSRYDQSRRTHISGPEQMSVPSPKARVAEFWDAASCGEELYLRGDGELDAYRRQAAERYRLEPFILEFADPRSTQGRSVLEIGVGLGADHCLFAEQAADLHGIDLTPRAIEHTRRRLGLFGLESSLSVGDAEHLDFPDNRFDVVYSWGVIHHSPDTAQAAREIVRVLKPGGEARVMIYHRRSLVGYMLWLRYALAKGRPLRSLDAVYADHLESPGTKAFGVAAAREMFRQAGADDVRIRVVQTHADLLTSEAGQQHRGRALAIARQIWPRWFIRRFMPRHGLFMLITARKAAL